MSVYSWGFSSKFAVFEPASGLPEDMFDRRRLSSEPRDWASARLIETYEVRGKPAPPGDFPATTGFMHLLSPRALDALGSEFQSSGTLIPVEIDGLPSGWSVFNPTRVVDCLDLDASKVSRLPFRPERITSIISPAFVQEKLPDRGLFIVPECIDGDIYVCEDIKMQVKKHKLKGFVLTENYLGKPWIS